jgi:hypothetical protein
MALLAVASKDEPIYFLSSAGPPQGGPCVLAAVAVFIGAVQIEPQELYEQGLEQSFCSLRCSPEKEIPREFE